MRFQGGGRIVLGADGITNALRLSISRLMLWVLPPVPAEIADALRQAQFNSVRCQVPMLLLVAALNTMIIMGICAHDGLPLMTYGWMAGLVLYCTVRAVYLHRRMAQPMSPERMSSMMKLSVGMSLIMVTGLGIMSSVTFVADIFSSETMVPISLAFGATSIAHCLYTLRRAAIGTLVMGMMPQSIVMMLFGDFQSRMLGLATLTVAVLMIRFVIAQYDQLITSLRLEKQNFDLANTDPLTGIANRRAIMALLDEEHSERIQDGAQFGVALLDLDGFKGVNDTLGHHSGDALLQHVANRLVQSALPSDTVGRLGGDEFIILLRNLERPADVSSRATAMLAALCIPADLGGVRVPVAASLGHAVFPIDAGTTEDLLIAADKALYAAKDANRAGRRMDVRAAA
jgi:diguanylate cyclase